MTEIERVYVRFRGRTIGPFTPDKLREMVRRGQVTRMHELSGDGLSWMKADEFGNFFPHAPGYSGAAGEMAASSTDVPPAGSDAGGTTPVANENATAQWYAHVNGEKQGPVSLDQMRLYAEAKILKKDSLVWKAGLDAWKPASEVLPELFGEKAKGGSVVSSSAGKDQSLESGPLATELAKNQTPVLLLGIGLLIIGVVFFVAQVFALTQAASKSNADIMSAVVQISGALAAAVAGVLAIQVGGKLKMAREASSPIAMLVAAKTLSQFWLIASVSVIIWVGILVLAMVAAAATGTSLLEVLV